MDISALYDHLREGAVSGAKALLGWELVHETALGGVGGYIVETEAYTQDDPASHTFKGMTKRNAAMFEDAGTIYVYFTYGMHYCVNIVCGEEGRGEGVLIRALQPTEGIELMQERRNTTNEVLLTNGPGKLTQALGIDLGHRGAVVGEGIHLEQGLEPKLITQTTRVGITKATDQRWRFYISGNPFISRI